LKAGTPYKLTVELRCRKNQNFYISLAKLRKPFLTFANTYRRKAVGKLTKFLENNCRISFFRNNLKTLSGEKT